MDPIDGLRYAVMFIPFVGVALRYFLGLNIIGLTGGIGCGKITRTNFSLKIFLELFSLNSAYSSAVSVLWRSCAEFEFVLSPGTPSQ